MAMVPDEEYIKLLETEAPPAFQIVRRLQAELAEANAAKEKAEAKCAAIIPLVKLAALNLGNSIVEGQPHGSAPEVIGRLKQWLKDSPGQPLLDKLARVGALIVKWRARAKREYNWAGRPQDEQYWKAADELEQALKGEPHE